MRKGNRMSTKPMNTLVICCDQHNPEITGCYGNAKVHTPNLDALAREGMVFDCAYTSTPICVPARASLACGDYAHRHGYWDNAHPFTGDQMSWGRRLKEAGVSVTTTGKLHFKDDSEYVFPGQRIPLNAKGGVGDMMTAARNSGTGTTRLREHVQHAGAGDSDYLHYDRNIAEHAARYLKEEATAAEDPWCLYVGFVTPHYPLIAPEEILDLYKPFDQFPIPEQWYDPSSLHPAVQAYKERVQMDDHVSPEELQRAIATYYAMVTFLDQQVGVVMNALEEAGLKDTTRVIYLDDHGDSAGDHGIFFKSNMYEGSVRIPLIVSGPDIPAGKRTSAPASILDIYPTLMDFHGVEMTDEERALPGVSLVKAANDEADPDRVIFSEYHCSGWRSSIFMVRKNEWKLVKYMTYDDCSLFNLKDDPKEMHDLGTDPAYADKVAELLTDLESICDTEQVTAQSFVDQKELLDSAGGLKAVAARGLTPFSAVPKGLGMDDGK